MKSKFLCNLFAFILLVSPCLAIADEGDVQISGFFFSTMFSQSDWYSNRSDAVINLDYTNDTNAVRVQVSDAKTGEVRRITYSRDFQINKNIESELTIGRFSRVSSFGDNITDIPTNAGMAMLPQSGYNYRMYTGSFVLMDGMQSKTKWYSDDAITTLVYAFGDMTIYNQKSLNQEIFKTLNTNVNVKTVPHSIDIALHYETKNVHLYTALSEYHAKLEAANTSRIALATVASYSNIRYAIAKVGAKYQAENWYIQSEIFEGETKTVSATGIEKVMTSAIDYNYVLGYDIAENYNLYAGQSHGMNRTANTESRESFVGVIRYNLPWTIALQYNYGHTNGAWRDYLSTVTNIRSAIVTVVYNFQ